MATLIRNSEASSLLADLEELWRCVDELFDGLSARDWSRRHGRDWTYADVPYHLSYFDDEIVARPLELGTAMPLEEQRVMRTINDLNAWNARNFARRPADETPERSRARMRAVRERVRAQLARMGDDDLARPVFVHLIGAGWIPAGAALGAVAPPSLRSAQDDNVGTRPGRGGAGPDTRRRLRDELAV
jgi:hypothetical protein